MVLIDLGLETIYWVLIGNMFWSWSKPRMDALILPGREHAKNCLSEVNLWGQTSGSVSRIIASIADFNLRECYLDIFGYFFLFSKEWMTCCQIALKQALRKKSGFFAVLDCLTLRVLEMEGDKIGVLVLAPHLLHCPVSFLVSWWEECLTHILLSWPKVCFFLQLFLDMHTHLCIFSAWYQNTLSLVVPE